MTLDILEEDGHNNSFTPGKGYDSSFLSNRYRILFTPRKSREGRVAYHSLPSSAKVKKSRAIPPPSYMSSWHSAYLIKHRENITFFTSMGYDSITAFAED
jgi:hypothetical protein